MLEVKGLRKSYGSRTVLRDVSFAVAPGRMTGFVGSNGAGKTTTMRIVLGLLSADAGAVTLNGQPMGADDRRRFGYMPEERGLYPKMKVHEQLVYLARLHGLAPERARANADRLLERLGLAERADDLVENLSLGNQQRAQIAAALVHEPDVLVLDEPFSGLDPIAIEVVLEVLRDAAVAGAPVLFSSHQLDLVERLCDDLVIIGDGEVKASGPRERLRQMHASPRWELEVTGDAGWVRGAPNIGVVELDGGYALVEAADDAAAQNLLGAASQRGPVLRFGREVPTLAEIFREVVS